MAKFHSNLVILAVFVSVSEKTDLICVGDDLCDLDSDLMFATTLLLVVKGVEWHLIKEFFVIAESIRARIVTHYLLTLLNYNRTPSCQRNLNEIK